MDVWYLDVAPRLFLAREERRKAAAVTSSLQKGIPYGDSRFSLYCSFVPEIDI